MSNMLQAVSILYKTKLPLMLVRGRLGPGSAAPRAEGAALSRWGALPAGTPPRRRAARPLGPPPRAPHHARHRSPRHPPAVARRRQVFNKIDVTRHEFALSWMDDFEAYAAALEADSSYAATLSRWAP
jgi:hypothetical protein